MLALSDEQLELVERGAAYLSTAQRDKYLRSLASRLRDCSFNTADLVQATVSWVLMPGTGQYLSSAAR